MRVLLFEGSERYSRSEQQTHRRVRFEVPVGALELWIEVRYAPKWVGGADALEIAAGAVRRQALAFGEVAPADVVEGWERHVSDGLHDRLVANLVTVSLDDARGRYRGAGHRHDAWQRLVIGQANASAGLVAGALPAGVWWLTVSAHTVVSDQVSVSIQIGAEMASRAPSGVRSSA